jgi:hypothetical protein
MNNKQMRVTEPLSEDFILIGKDIEDKSGRSIGSASSEEQAFHEFFSTTAVVATKLWDHLLQHDMIPGNETTQHLMWILYFMRAYPKEGVTCSVVGGSGGSINPKTLCNYIWPFIHAIAELSLEVVSLFCVFFCNISNVSSPYSSRFVLRTEK